MEEEINVGDVYKSKWLGTIFTVTAVDKQDRLVTCETSTNRTVVLGMDNPIFMARIKLGTSLTKVSGKEKK